MTKFRTLCDRCCICQPRPLDILTWQAAAIIGTTYVLVSLFNPMKSR